ncbi:MAG: hypothetical protein M3126_12120 [Candidatus Eremiobacteraeota bacterium]|nr:hypothetical protein [Candidatus Eremiobacteraeota bacterium]
MSRFWRHGFSLKYDRKQVALTGTLQTGNDSSAGGNGHAARSSGGFLETTYRFSVCFSGIVRPRRNMRFTLEGVQNAGHASANAGLLFAY